MKRTLKYIVIGLLLPFLTSCIFEEVMDVAESSEAVTVTFTLDAGSPVTKAGEDVNWNEEYDTIGDSFENRINATNLIVLAYSDKGKFLAELPILKKTHTGNSVSFVCAYKYRKEDLNDSNKTFKIVVLANCVDEGYGLGYKDDVPDLDNLLYSIPANTGYIPMWGIKEYELEIEDGAVSEDQQVGTISMLRAMAKIGVSLSEDLQGEFQIKEGSLRLNYARSTGYSVPNGWNSLNLEGKREPYHNSVFKPADGPIITNISTYGYDANGGYYIYVPETDNEDDEFEPTAGDPKDLTLALVIQKMNGDKVVKEYEFPYSNGIKFCNYVNGLPEGDHFNIIRNHYYDFVITGLKTGLEVDLQVADWEDEPVWDLDFSAPIHSKLMTAPAADAAAPTEMPVVRYDNTDATGEAGAFVGYFMMESPAGVTWRPTLADASTVDYEVRIYSTDGINPEYNVPVTEDAVEAEKNRFYKIVVVAKNPNNVGNVIKLGLTYTASWNAEANPLLVINKGDNSGFYYQNAGKSDIHWISIKQQ